MNLAVRFWIFAFCAILIKANEVDYSDPVLKLLKIDPNQQKVNLYVDEALKYLGETRIKINSELFKTLKSLSSTNAKELIKVENAIQKADYKLSVLGRNNEINQACVATLKPALSIISDEMTNNVLFCIAEPAEELKNLQNEANILLDELQNDASNLRNALGICDDLEGKIAKECIIEQLKQVKHTVSSIKTSANTQRISFDKLAKNLENVQKSCIKYVEKELNTKLSYVDKSVQKCIKNGGPPTTTTPTATTSTTTTPTTTTPTTTLPTQTTLTSSTSDSTSTSAPSSYGPTPFTNKTTSTSSASDTTTPLPSPSLPANITSPVSYPTTLPTPICSTQCYVPNPELDALRAKIKECLREVWQALRNKHPNDVVNEAKLRECSAKILHYISAHEPI